jgi:hypothetical protein
VRQSEAGRWTMLRERRHVLGRYYGQLPPLRRSWVLVILVIRVMTVIDTLRMVDVAADLFSLVLVPPLLSTLLLLPIFIVVVLPCRNCCVLLLFLHVGSLLILVL